MTAATPCHKCGTEPREGARFCDGCGAPITKRDIRAEYKQVTVLFADVVHSMDIAAAVGPERLREIMADLADRCAAVVQRYGGTVDKFTGDGIMVVFGAPVALEDHAFRACLAALGVQEEAQRLAADVRDRDGVDLQLRVGLNSGEVIAGEIGSGPFGYTAVGEQVGMAQRMESAAPPDGVMLSDSTARLVEHAAVLGEPEQVHIKGAEAAVPARRLLEARSEQARPSPRQPVLVGRASEMRTVTGMLEQAVNGERRVAGILGPPGIGKSRMVGEAAKLATGRGFRVYTTFCESHAREIPFRVAARLLRTVFQVRDMAPAEAWARIQTRCPDANREDLLLLADLLGIGDPNLALPAITPDARRRRLAALLNTAAVERSTPIMYVIEDAHWIDEASESMLGELITAVPEVQLLVLVTYRHEYRGALSQIPGARTIALAPLGAAPTAALLTELLGEHPSVIPLAAQVADRAAGNPFFACEMVRDLAERGVLRGERGAYVCHVGHGAISVPATLQATIAARIDRLSAPAKRVLYAGAVIGARFQPDLLDIVLGEDGGFGVVLAELREAEIIDQVLSAPPTEYAFRHPLIRTVAYQSQLKVERADLHRRVAAAITESNPTLAEQNAALIAEHLEAAGDLRAAFDWHMRAGTWSLERNRSAARVRWQRARLLADSLPADDADRVAMQIAPRTLLCATVWVTGGSVDDTGFEELRELCAASGEEASLAIGMAGLVMALAGHNRLREASQLASDFTALLEAIGDPNLTVGLLPAAIYAKSQVGEMTEALRLAELVIDLADGDVTKGIQLLGSPLAMATEMRGLIRLCLGINGWRSDADAAVTMAASTGARSHVGAILYKYIVAIPIGARSADSTALRETRDALQIAERTSDDYTLRLAQLTRGLVLVHHVGPHREEGFHLLQQAREAALKEGFTMNALAVVDPEIARERVRNGDFDSAIELARASIDDMFATGSMFLRGVATAVLVESLLARGGAGDPQDAEAAIDRLAALPTDAGFVLHELPLLRLRALLARTRGDEASYRDYRDRYREMAGTLGFEGHIAWAAAMP
jgi:adenylate cyclase